MAQRKNSGGTRQIRVSEPQKRTASSTGRHSERPGKAHGRASGGAAERATGGATRSTGRASSGGVKSASRTAKNSASGTRKKTVGRFPKLGEMDYTLLFLIILVVVVGLIILLSASAPSGKRIYDDSYYYFKRQLLFAVFGFVGMIIVSTLDFEKYLHLIPKGFWICVLLLVLVLIPGLGVESNGARRWLNIPFVQLQPSELMKPAIAMYIAYLVHTKAIDLKTLRGNGVCAFIIGIVALLLMLETHLSGTIVIVGIAVCVMIAGGTPIKPLILGILGAGVLIFIYLQFDAERMARITSLFDPFADAQDSGYQISQSIYAIGSGRFFGLGLGESVQKYSNLPEPYNDFIFSIVCEELGFIGATIIILLFVALFLQSMRVAMSAPDVWTSLVCVGIASQIGIQTVLNMGVAISLIPNTGVSLPFFSYGGTSILTLLLEMGVLLNVSRRTVK